jgi:hypothetical protein
MPTLPNEMMNVHIKPGSVFLYTDNSNKTYKTTESILQAPVSLVVSRDADLSATGDVFLDDGKN